jgi:hypothetical protein
MIVFCSYDIIQMPWMTLPANLKPNSVCYFGGPLLSYIQRPLHSYMMILFHYMMILFHYMMILFHYMMILFHYLMILFIIWWYFFIIWWYFFIIWWYFPSVCLSVRPSVRPSVTLYCLCDNLSRSRFIWKNACII